MVVFYYIATIIAIGIGKTYPYIAHSDFYRKIGDLVLVAYVVLVYQDLVLLYCLTKLENY